MIWIQLIFFFTPVSYIWWRYGVQKSISESYYKLREDHYLNKVPKLIGAGDKSDAWVFSIFTFGTGLPMWLYTLEHDVHSTTAILIGVSGFFMAGIGIASEFKRDNIVNIVHYLSATFAIAFAFIAIWYEQSDWMSAVLFLLGAAALKWGVRVKNFTWWVEIFAFLFIIIRLAAL